jgi:hypothetical protein
MVSGLPDKRREEYEMDEGFEQSVEIPFSKFYVAVARRVESKCGMTPDDLPDIDFRAFYLERGTIEEYRAAIAECVYAVLEGAGYPFSDEDEYYS